MKLIRMIVIFAVLLLPWQFVSGVSISPEVLKELRESGNLQNIVNSDMQARERGVWQPDSDPYRFGLSATVDTLHCLIILVDFSDMTHESDLHTEPPDFDTLLFSLGIRTPGSMADYYDETSYGQAYLTGQVTNWYRMPQTYAYYVDGQRGFGNYPRNAQRLTEDAVLAADPDVDFSQFDNDGDGRVDALFVVHAGPGYEDTGNLNYIHSHAWVTSYHMNIDGVVVYGYSMEPEETGSHRLINIGVFCHEFGHVLGLPDLYDYDYDSEGVGVWSVMAGGSWGGGGATPVHFDAWCKYQLGWAIPTSLFDNLPDAQLDAVEYNPNTYQLFSQGISDPQYFIVENRRREAFDISIPGGGLLIYHIDENAPNNNDQTHYKVAVEQADGMFDLENNRGGDLRDPWPGGTDNRTFDDFSTPNSHLYGDVPSEVAVSNISDSDSTMFADLGVVYIDPLYQLLSMTFNDSSGNSNGRPEAGETCALNFSAQNIRASVSDLLVIANCSDPLVIFSDSTSQFGYLPVNMPFDNSSDPIVFSLPDGYTSNFARFSLTFIARNGLYRQTISRRVLLGNPDLLLVDDDRGASIDTFYTAVLDSIGHTYQLWNVSTQGSPASALPSYENVIWFTGDTWPDPMPAGDVEGLISYLDGGGHLLITGQDFVQRLYERGSGGDSLLLNQYLKVSYNVREIDHRPTGQPGTVFDSLTYLTSGSGGDNNQVSQDSYNVWPEGVVLLSYRSGRAAGVGFTGSYISLTVGFGAEGINDDFPALYSTMRSFIAAALEYLNRPVSVNDDRRNLPLMTSLGQNYPNPFNASTKISFDIARSGPAELAIFDIAGRLIARPLDGIVQAGHHEITWDAGQFPSGIYFYKLGASEGSITKRMTLLK